MSRSTNYITVADVKADLKDPLLAQLSQATGTTTTSGAGNGEERIQSEIENACDEIDGRLFNYVVPITAAGAIAQLRAPALAMVKYRLVVDRPTLADRWDTAAKENEAAQKMVDTLNSKRGLHGAALYGETSDPSTTNTGTFAGSEEQVYGVGDGYL